MKHVTVSAFLITLAALVVASKPCLGGPPLLVNPGALANLQPAETPQGDATPLPLPRVQSYDNSGCLLGPDGEIEWPCGDDEFEFTTHGTTLYVVHRNLTYNCCPDDILIWLTVTSGRIVLTEEEDLTSGGCDCWCCYETTATVVDLAPGTYTVEFWWFDYEPWQMQCHVDEIVIEGADPPLGDPPGLKRVNGTALPAGPAAEADPGLRPPRVESYGNSGCWTGPNGDPWQCEEDDEISFSVEGHTLHVLHENANYNCCPDDIVISVSVEDGWIRLTEEEILTLPCWCICCYSVEATVVDLPSGHYTAEFCWYDYDTQQVECYVEEIVIGGTNPPLGNPPGPKRVDGAAVPAAPAAEAEPGLRPPRVESYGNSGCWTGPNGDPWPCEEDDKISFNVEGHTLHVVHENANYNCCLEDIVISVSVEGEWIRLAEEEVVPDPCYCICCYSVEATIVDLASGHYTAELCWYDYDTHQVECYAEEVVIP